MRLNVVVKPNSKKSEILEQTADTLKVAICEPAEDNKANIELIRFLKKTLKKEVRIVSGLKSKKKIVEIN